jgi:hypothetical protein
MIRAGCAAALALAGCLDAQVSDEPGLPGLVLPAGSAVPSAHDDPAIERQIDDSDGVGEVVPLLHGFAGGQPVAYWDFGPAPEFAAPIFVLVAEAAGGELEPIAHPTIIDAIPGDPAYSPFWALILVKVTAAYQGELLTSFAAVQEAEQRGLVEAPRLQDEAVNCPAVASGVTLELGGDAEPLPPPAEFFWQGMTVSYYDFGRLAIERRAVVPASARYLLRREGGEPLSEVVRGVDMTGDGDANDTNDVFAHRAGQPDFSPLARTVDVAVAAGTGSIDTSGDQAESDIRAADQLFDPDAVEGTVVGFTETDELRNLPQQQEPGSL